MKVTEVCQNYCIGCGLCKSERDVMMPVRETGFLSPQLTENMEDFLEQVCPIAGVKPELLSKDIWGTSLGAYAAYSKDGTLRKKASSGGVLTSLSIFLLEAQLVDGVIHMVADESNPTATVCKISYTREEVLEGCGSRYSISSPWLSLSQMIEPEKRYAAIGKPCDIMALRNLKDNTGKYENIEYLLSFFCAGMPSKLANDKLLKELNCDNQSCRSLTYRGNGWPGYATAVDKAGKEHTMEYSKAWGGILGRDVHAYCKLCMDGIGLAADISCGDGWYLTEDGKQPDFTEREGRNIVFVRTLKGKKLFEQAVQAGELYASAWEELEQLKIIQKYQYTRRTTMKDKLLAFRLFGKPVPRYDKGVVNQLSKQGPCKERTRIFLGTVKRILQKRL